MDRAFLSYYEAELAHIRELSVEFAALHPTVARNLSLDAVPCPDPYVERLLEGVAYLAARTRLKLDGESQRHVRGILDALTPFFAVIAVGLGLSHLAAGSAFGSPTDLPWGIDLWNATRHPTQIYETLASFLVVILLWRSKPHPRPGISFLFFASLTALTELILLAFRAEYTSLTNGFRQEQVIAWVTLLACFILLEVRLKPVKKQTL